jgi:hypothetical protein
LKHQHPANAAKISERDFALGFGKPGQLRCDPRMRLGKLAAFVRFWRIADRLSHQRFTVNA